jgi:hypothetical protein
VGLQKWQEENALVIMGLVVITEVTWWIGFSIFHVL